MNQSSAMSRVDQTIQHELAHAVRRLRYGENNSTTQCYSDNEKREFLVQELRKFQNPTEYNSVYYENKYLNELRDRGIDAPRRTRYLVPSCSIKNSEKWPIVFRGFPTTSLGLYEGEYKRELARDKECLKNYQEEEAQRNEERERLRREQDAKKKK